MSFHKKNTKINLKKKKSSLLGASWVWLINSRRKKMSFPGGSVEKNVPANAGDTGDLVLIPGSGRSPD